MVAPGGHVRVLETPERGHFCFLFALVHSLLHKVAQVFAPSEFFAAMPIKPFFSSTGRSVPNFAVPVPSLDGSMSIVTLEAHAC